MANSFSASFTSYSFSLLLPLSIDTRTPWWGWTTRRQSPLFSLHSATCWAPIVTFFPVIFRWRLRPFTTSTVCLLVWRIRMNETFSATLMPMILFRMNALISSFLRFVLSCYSTFHPFVTVTGLYRGFTFAGRFAWTTWWAGRVLRTAANFRRGFLFLFLDMFNFLFLPKKERWNLIKPRSPCPLKRRYSVWNY